MTSVQAEYIDASDYSGVVLVDGEWRVIAGPSGNRYWLQRKAADGRWHEVKRRKLPSALAKVLPPECPISADSVRALPEAASDAAPETVARRKAFNDAFRATDYNSDEYARLVAQDERYRLVVSSDGLRYVIVRKADLSILRQFGTASEARIFVRATSESVSGRIGVQFIKSDVLLCALSGLPERPSEGGWPELPERPQSARERRQRANSEKVGADREKSRKGRARAAPAAHGNVRRS